MSIKHFDKEQNKWVIFPGTIGAPGKDAYMIAQEGGYTGTLTEFTKSLAEVPSAIETVYNQHSSAQITSNVSIFETGVSTPIILTTKVLYNGKAVVPSKLSLKAGSTVLSEDVRLTSYNDTISSSTTYTLSAEVYPKVVKSSSLTINSYYPLYYGASSKSTLTSADVLGLVKQPIKSTPAGNVNISVQEGQYIWLCVPSTMKITKVTSSGFDVPMNSKITVNVDGKTSYDCYRSAETFKAGTFNGVII